MVLALKVQTRRGKGRSFQGVVLAYATASGLWGGGSDAALRPVFLVMAASDDEARSVLENLRAGERTTVTGEHLASGGIALELMRSANYAFATQRTPEGTVITAYLPELFDFQPGLLDPDAVRFVVLPAQQDLAELPLSADDLTAAWRHLSALGDPAESTVSRELCALASLWAAYLDQRCELPLPPDLDFRVQLYVAALREGLASKPLPLRTSSAREADQHGAQGFRLYVAEGFPLACGIATRAEHAWLAEFLAEQLQRYERARPAAARRRHLAAAQLQAAAPRKREAA